MVKHTPICWKSQKTISKTVACYDNHNSTYVHEMIHWMDAQRYMASHSNTDGYINAIREESRKNIEKLIESGYNIESISKYAHKSYMKGFFDETWVEYRVKKFLGGK